MARYRASFVQRIKIWASERDNIPTAAGRALGIMAAWKLMGRAMMERQADAQQHATVNMCRVMCRLFLVLIASCFFTLSAPAQAQTCDLTEMDIPDGIGASFTIPSGQTLCAQNSVDRSVSLTVAGTLQVEPGVMLNLNGSFANQGLIVFEADSAGATSSIGLNGSMTCAGGSIEAQGAPAGETLDFSLFSQFVGPPTNTPFPAFSNGYQPVQPNSSLFVGLTFASACQIASSPAGTVLGTDMTSNSGVGTINNLEGGTNRRVRARRAGRLIGARDNVTIIAQTMNEVLIPIDPSGRIYDAVTRDLIEGAVVEITDASDTPLPALCVVPGQQPQTTGSDGFYRFNLIPGADAACPTSETEYRISVTPPAAFSAPPSASIPPETGAFNPTGTATNEIAPNADRPQNADPTTYYLNFLLAAGDPDVVNNHIPLDAVVSDPLASLPPFTCSGDFFQVHGTPTSNVSLVDLTNGTFSTIANSGANVRATGLDPDSLFAYAIQTQGGGTAGNVLFAIGSDGSAVNLGTVSGLVARNYPSGDFGPDGLFYIRNNGNNRPLVAIDVETRSVVSQFTPVGVTSNPNTADFAFNPVDQSFYAVESGSANARLLRFTLNADTTFTVASIGTTGVQTSGGGGNNVFGAMYADSSGNVFGIQNSTGRLYQFSTIDGTSVLVGRGAIGSQNDGFSCSEVETVIPRDFGDAQTDGTIVAGIATNYGAASQARDPGNLFIGVEAPTAEDSNINASDNADGDANEEAVLLDATQGALSYDATVSVFNNTGSDAFLCGFIDAGAGADGFDGTFDTGSERVCTLVANNNAAQDVELNWTDLDFGTNTTTFLRLRLATVQSEAEAPSGDGTSIGEVEDYAVTIAAPVGPPVCTILTANGLPAASTASHTILTATSPANQLAWEALPGPALFFGTVEATYEGDFTSNSTNFGVINRNWNAGTHANSGNGINYNLNGIYSAVDRIALLNDVNPPNTDDGIANFTVNLYDNTGALLGAETFSAASTFTLQTFEFSGTYHNVASYDLVINTAFTRAPVQYSEVALQGSALTCGTTPVLTDNSDAPITGTSFGAPSHVIVSGTQLGATVTADNVTFDSPNADGDIDDGVTIPALTQGQTVTISAEVAGAGGFLQGWIDFDGNDVFDAGEQIATNLQDDGTGDDATANDGTITFAVPVPAGAITTQTFARFRWSTVSGLDTTTAAPDGEVEDYAVTIASAPSSVVASCQVAQAVSENLVPGRTLNVSCVADVGVTSDGSTGNPGYCPNLPLPAGYEIAYDYVLPADDRMLGLAVWANAGGAFGDAELRSFDLEVDYTDASGAPATLIMDGVNIGDTTSINDPRSITFIENGAPVSLPNVSQVRIGNLGAVGGSTVFRELQGVCGDDVSDAPADFSEASHTFDPQVRLGATIDADTISLASPNADGDDNSNIADEDGVTIPALTQGQTVTISAEVTGAGGFLQGWIDFDGNDVFDDSEQIATDLQDNGTGDDATANDGTITFAVPVPADAITTQTFARFRWSTVSGLDTAIAAPDGEVEDYAVTIAEALAPFTCPAEIFQIHTNNGIVSSVDLTNETLVNLPDNIGFAVNSAGYRASDNYAYGVTTGAGPGNPGNLRLIRVGGDGTSDNLGIVTGLPNAVYNQGDFGADGLLHVRSGATARIFRIDVDTVSVVSSYAPSPALPPSGDFAFNPVDEKFYITNGATLFRFDPETETRETVGPVGIGHAFGAMIGDAAGNIYGVDNTTGRVIQVDTATGAGTVVGQGAPADFNDGFFCPLATFTPPVAIIRGSVFVDDNQNNTFDTGEVEVSNVSVSVFTAGPDGEFGSPDDILEASGETGSPYELVVPPGTYDIRVDVADPDLPPGTRPSITTFRTETLAAGDILDGINFGVAAEDTAVPVTPAPTNAFCVAPTNWRQLSYTGVTSDFGPVTVTSSVDGLSANIDFNRPADTFWEDTNTATNIFDESEHTTILPNLLSTNLIYNPGPIIGLNQTFTQSFVGRPVYEVFVHFNSIDQVQYIFELAQNPGIGWELVSGNDDLANIAAAPDFAFVDILEADQDINPPQEAAGGDAGLSADGTVRFYSLTEEPINQLIWRFEEDPFNRDLFERIQWGTEVCMPLEFSDAPTTGTSYGAASHGVVADIRLGDLISPDAGAFDSPDASADDDDGVTVPLLQQGETATFTADVSGVGGFLQGWIDLNGNGAFEATEQIATDVQDDGTGDDATANDGIITFNFAMPVGVTLDPTFARFRWSTQSGLDPIADAPDGEVEDYQVSIDVVAQPPFVCTPQLLQSFVAASGAPAQLAVLDPLAAQFDPIGNTSHGVSYNAIGLDVRDGFLYGMKATTNELVRIGSDGSVVDLGPVAGLPLATTGSGSYISGDFNSAGQYVIAEAFLDRPLYTIDVGTRSVVATHNLSGLGGFPANVAADIGYNPTTDTFFTVTLAGTFIEIDIDAGSVRTVGPTGVATSAVVGAIYGDNSGRILGSYNDGQGVFELDLATGAASFVSPVPPSGINDGGGAFCRDADLDLPPVIDLNSIANGSDVDFGPVAFVEDGFDTSGDAVGSGPVFIVDTDADVSDVNEADIVSLTLAVDIASIVDGPAETLSFAGADFPLDVDGSATVNVGGTNFRIDYVAATGLFTVTHDAGPGNILPQDALDAFIVEIAYNHTSDEPTEGVRNFAFTVSDGSNTSNPAVTSVNVTASLDNATLSGAVFFDNGVGTGATAHNGLIEGDEAGAGGVSVEAVDVVTGNIIATTGTAGDGTYAITLPPEQNGRETLIRVTPPSGTVLISNTSAIPAVTIDTANRTFTLTPMAGDSFGGLDFGLVIEPRLTEDRSVTLAPGQSTLLTHTFTAQTAMDVTLSLANEVQSVNGSFTTVLFGDTNCDGAIGAGETALTGPLSVAAGDEVCVIARVSSAAGTAAGVTISFDIEATGTFTGTTFPFALGNTDTVTVLDGEVLQLTKEVCNMTNNVCDLVTGAGFEISNGGVPGDVIVYRLTFENPGPDSINDVTVSDQTPAFSALTATAPAVIQQPAGLTCTLSVPSAPVAGDTGPLAWACTGNLAPGELGVLSFEVQIDE